MTTDPDDFVPLDNNPTVYLYNITELTMFVNRTVTNYFNLGSNDNLDFYVPNIDADGIVVPVVMFNLMFGTSTPIVEYQLTP